MSPLMLKIGAGLLLAAVAFGLWNYVGRLQAKVADLEDEVGVLLTAVRVVTENPKLRREDAAAQLYVFGASHDALEDKLDHVSGLVDGLGAESARLQKIAADARAGAVQRATEAARSRSSLEASARSGGVSGACLSDEFKRRWK